MVNPVKSVLKLDKKGLGSKQPKVSRMVVVVVVVIVVVIVVVVVVVVVEK